MQTKIVADHLLHPLCHTADAHTLCTQFFRLLTWDMLSVRSPAQSSEQEEHEHTVAALFIHEVYMQAPILTVFIYFQLLWALSHTKEAWIYATVPGQWVKRATNKAELNPFFQSTILYSRKMVLPQRTISIHQAIIKKKIKNTEWITIAGTVGTDINRKTDGMNTYEEEGACSWCNNFSSHKSGLTDIRESTHLTHWVGLT